MGIIKQLHPKTNVIFTNEVGSSNRITIPTFKGINILHKSDILYLKSSSNYAEIFHKDGTSILSSKTLKHYERIIGQPFIRVHNSYLVNPEHLVFIHSSFNWVRLIAQIKIPVSRSRKSALKSYVNGFM